MGAIGLLAAAAVLVGTNASPAAGSPALQGPGLDVEPNSGPAGAEVTVSGSGWGGANSPYVILWESSGGTELGSFSPGDWSTNVTIPSGASPGNYSIVACAGHGTEFESCASTSFKVIVEDTPTPSATFTPSVTPSPTPTPTPTLSACIDQINILSPSSSTDEPVDLSEATEGTLKVEVIYGRDEPPEVLFFANDGKTPHTRFSESTEGPGVQVAHDPENPYRYLFTVEGLPLRPGRNEWRVEVPTTCGFDDDDEVIVLGGDAPTATPGPGVCGSLGLGPDPHVISFDETTPESYLAGIRAEYGVSFGQTFERYRPEVVSPRSGNWVGASTQSREFGSILRPIRMSFARPLRAVGMFVGLDGARYVETEVTATLRAYGYRGGEGELRPLGTASVSFPPEPTDVSQCLAFEAEEGDLITKAILDYRDAEGTSMAERRLMDDLTLVFDEEGALPEDSPPTVLIEFPGYRATIERADLTARARISEDRELSRVWYRLNDGVWNEIAFTEAPDSPDLYRSSVALATEFLRFDEENTITFRAEDSAGQRAVDAALFRFEPDDALHFLLPEFSLSQHGAFDVEGFPEFLVENKSGVLRVEGTILGGESLEPATVSEAELEVLGRDGVVRSYRGHRRVDTWFEPGGPFSGVTEIYFFLPAEDFDLAGSYDFSFTLQGDSGVIQYGRFLGSAMFQTMPTQYQFMAPVEDPFSGPAGDGFLAQITHMPRVYPVMDGLAQFGAPIERAEDHGIVYEIAPDVIDLPNGENPYTGEESFAWDFIQDEAENRARAVTDKGRAVDCNGNGTTDDDPVLGWLIGADIVPGFKLGKMDPRSHVQWDWNKPEDVNGDGVFSQEELALWVVEFYDMDGDESWHAYEGAARDQFSPGDPYLTFQDSNGNCVLDGSERDTLSPGARRKANAWSYMRSQAERMMDEFTSDHGLSRIATSAVIPEARATGLNIVGNCGRHMVCWSTTHVESMVIAHELGHGWGLSHQLPQSIPGGAVNLLDRRWVPQEQSRNFMYKDVGNLPGENFASAEAFEQLFNPGRLGWRYGISDSGDTGMARLQAPARRRPPQENEVTFALYGSIGPGGVLQIDETRVYQQGVEHLPEPGPYSLLFLDEEGNILRETRFGVIEGTVCDGCEEEQEQVVFERAYLSIHSPLPARTERVEVRRTGELLESLDVSLRSPSVEWVAPASGAVRRDDATILRWRAEDQDGDDLTYSLAYSADGGESFVPFAVGLQETEYRWSPTSVAGSQEAVIRVTANDGFHDVTATSPPLTVANGPPEIAIISPSQGSVLGDDGVIVLRALALDSEEGPLGGEQVVWTDDEGTPIGTGQQVTLNGYRPGEHTFRVTATDREGLEATASVQIELVESPPSQAVQVDERIVLSTRQSTLAAGACSPSTTRLSAEFPSGVRAENVRLMVNAAGQPDSLRGMQAEGQRVFSVELGIGEGDPIGEWEFAVVADTASGETWSEAASFEVVKCPQAEPETEQESQPRQVVLPLAIGALGLALLGGLALGGWRIVKRVRKTE